MACDELGRMYRDGTPGVAHPEHADPAEAGSCADGRREKRTRPLIVVAERGRAQWDDGPTRARMDSIA